MVGPRSQIDLARLSIRTFCPDTMILNRFDCGHSGISSFLKSKARKCVSRNECRVFTAHLGSDNKPCGYYALQLGAHNVSFLKDRGKSYITNYSGFPSVHIQFFAVQHESQRQGIGRYMLVNALEKSYEISKHAGFYAVTLESLNQRSTDFYKSIGFEVYSTEGNGLIKMLFPIKSVIELFERV